MTPEEFDEIHQQFRKSLFDFFNWISTLFDKTRVPLTIRVDDQYGNNIFNATMINTVEGPRFVDEGLEFNKVQ